MKRIKSVIALCMMLLLCFQTMPVYAFYETKPGGLTYNGMKIPVYDGDFYEVIHGNVPTFKATEKTPNAFEQYSDLDGLGRCGEAYANVCKETMPAEGEKRGAIGSIYPSGWKFKGKSNNHKYDSSIVSGGYIYNRSHLIGWQLTGENANERNLITGTRYFNDPVMLKFENQVADYVKKTNHHVLYRVTPVFDGKNLVADGVIMEAESVEDKKIEFCVFCYNIQKGIEIDYATGENRLVTDGAGKIDISKCQVTISPTKYTYTGSPLKPRVQIYNQGVLLDESEYSVTYKNNVDPGKGLVVITGKGAYTGNVTKEFTINKVTLEKGKIKTVTAGSKKLTVTWNRVKGAQGYELQYRLGKGKYKTLKIAKSATVKRTISKLKSKKSYQVRVRAYKNVGKKTFYGAYSSLVSRKTK